MKSIHLLAAALLAAASLAAAAAGNDPHGHAPGQAEPDAKQTDWGIAAEPRAARRTVRVTAADGARLAPAIIEVGEDETVQLVLRNAGQAAHEMVLGTRKELEEHAARLRTLPRPRQHAPHVASAAPGQSGSITWTFNRPGEFEFACLVPGHAHGEAGRIRVIPRAGHKH